MNATSFEMILRHGQFLFSKVWLNPENNKPLLMKITKVTKSAVYYRPYYGLHDDGTEWLGAPAWIENKPEAIAKYLEC